MELIVFKVHKVDDPFVYDCGIDLTGCRKPSWTLSSTTTSQHLSEILNRQCRYNHYVLDRQQKTSIRRQGVQPHMDFLSQMEYHTSSLRVDQEILSSGRDDIYAIVIAGSEGYGGHVYAFRSTTDTNLFYLYRPRARIDILFIGGQKYSADTLLLEGCRRLAAIRGCEYLGIYGYVEEDGQALRPVYTLSQVSSDVEKFTLLE